MTIILVENRNGTVTNHYKCRCGTSDLPYVQKYDTFCTPAQDKLGR
jgi:hypothetical protein